MPSRTQYPCLITGLVMLLAGSPASSAQAAGGASIASAPVVVYGQQEFGNSATDGGVNPARECAHQPKNGWWTLTVTTGDEVTIDWEALPSQYLEVFPPGTTDFTVANTPSLASSLISSNGRAQLSFTARVGGIMPLVIGTEACDDPGDPGPYSFTAYVAHAVRLSLPRVGHLRPGSSVPVGVHTPDGAPITDPALTVTVQLLNHGHWQSLGTASPSNGVATIALQLPHSLHRHLAALRAIAQGPDYQHVSSASERVGVT